MPNIQGRNLDSFYQLHGSMATFKIMGPIGGRSTLTWGLQKTWQAAVLDVQTYSSHIS